jgi:hypothetical protein
LTGLACAISVVSTGNEYQLDRYFTEICWFALQEITHNAVGLKTSKKMPKPPSPSTLFSQSLTLPQKIQRAVPLQPSDTSIISLLNSGQAGSGAGL